MLHVRVPATSANMGSGFDSIGIAVKLYNHVWVEPMEKGLEISFKRKPELPIPADEKNLIYKTMKNFYEMIGKPMPGIRMIQEDFIPTMRGLGSSSACIVEGLMAANELSGTHMTKEELAPIAARIEGHPDNSDSALLGGMVVGVIDEGTLKTVKITVPKHVSFGVMVPDFPVSTAMSRGVLPQMVSRKDAIFNASRAGLLVASMMSGNLDNLKIAMDDRLHQSYRAKLIPHMEDIFAAGEKFGAKASYLSGAGSTLMAVLDEKDAADLRKRCPSF